MATDWERLLTCYAAFFVMVAARGSDLYITLAIDPTLAAEQNPFEQGVGWGWPGLVALNAAAVLAATVLFAWASAHRGKLRPKQPGLGFRAFVRRLEYGRTAEERHLIHTVAPRRALAMVGLYLPWAVVLGSLAIDASHLAALRWTGWAHVHNGVIGESLRAVLAAGAVMAVAWGAWLLFEWRLYRRHRAPSPVPR